MEEPQDDARRLHLHGQPQRAQHCPTGTELLYLLHAHLQQGEDEAWRRAGQRVYPYRQIQSGDARPAGALRRCRRADSQCRLFAEGVLQAVPRPVCAEVEGRVPARLHREDRDLLPRRAAEHQPCHDDGRFEGGGGEQHSEHPAGGLFLPAEARLSQVYLAAHHTYCRQPRHHPEGSTPAHSHAHHAQSRRRGHPPWSGTVAGRPAQRGCLPVCPQRAAETGRQGRRPGAQP